MVTFIFYLFDWRFTPISRICDSNDCRQYFGGFLIRTVDKNQQDLDLNYVEPIGGLIALPCCNRYDVLFN